MKKEKLIIWFIMAFTTFCNAKTIRLGVINPNPANLEKIVYLTNHRYIDLDNLEIIGIFHDNQHESVESANEYIRQNEQTNISILTIKKTISLDSLFLENQCTDEFRELFLMTDGLIFLGGDDIPPQIYGEKTFLTTEQIPYERNWEISFLFHLTGGFQNKEYVPLLEQKTDYSILGICLGMQEMNVAGGGTLYQDIPFEIYGKTTYESVLEQDLEKQHKNYRKKIDKSDNSTIRNFHHIKITPNSILDFGQLQNPLVTSTHHQAIRKLGKNLQIIATSMDGKIVEAIAHTKYKNVYGVQFHPELSDLYENREFKNSLNETFSLDNDTKLFHENFWKEFSDRLKNNRK